MNLSVARTHFSVNLGTAVLVSALAGLPAMAQEKKAVPAPKVAVPAKAAAPAPKAAAGGTAGATAHTATGATTAAHTGGVTTANHGGTTAGRGPVTTTTTRTTTTNTTSRTGPGVGRSVAAPRTVTTNRMTNGRPIPEGNRVVRTANGSEFRRRPDGRVGDMHVAGRNMEIHNHLAGGRRVEVERADHSRVFAERGGRGYIERPYGYGGHEFARRSYYYNGRAYNHYYGHYYYRGAYVNYYTPAVYYRPAFYGWAYNPWVAPVPYAWGFAGNPWYGYYGPAYFAPYPVYPSAAFWLTDYLISTSLASAYQARLEANAEAIAQAQGAAPVGVAGLTPDVKDLISAEVQRQIALENQEAQTAQAAVPDPASSSIQRMLGDNIQHVFVVGRDLDVMNAANAECAVSQGDALQLVAPPPPESATANLIVLSSKGGVECRKADTVQVQVADMQEMQNHMRETIDAGLGELQSKQGKGSLPVLPSSAAGEPVKAAFVSAAPAPESNVQGEINQQLQAADQAEREVTAQGGPSDASMQQVASAAPVAVQSRPVAATSTAPVSMTGMSPDEVIAAMGQPMRIVDLGVKKIYMYKDLKITFKNGKVSDAQ